MKHTTTLADGTTTSALVQSPSVPANEIEMLATLRAIIARKSDNGQSFQFIRNGRNALDMLRREVKSRLNMLPSDKLDDATNALCVNAVAAFQKGMLEGFLEDGFALTNVRKGIAFVKFDSDGNIKSDGLANTARAEREFRNDGERLAGYQIARAQLEKRLARMRENPGKYERHELAAVEAKLAQCGQVISAIMANNAKRNEPAA